MNSDSYVFRSGEMLFEYMNKYSYDKINDSDKLLYYCNSIIKGTVCNYFSSPNYRNNLICLVRANRTNVSPLYCTTISKHLFGGGYLKLEISFHFFKNAKADSHTHSLLNFSISPIIPSPHLTSKSLNPSPHLPFTHITLS